MVPKVESTSTNKSQQSIIGIKDNDDYDEPAEFKGSRKRRGVLRQRRRPGGFGPFGALLLVASLVQRSMAAGGGGFQVTPGFVCF